MTINQRREPITSKTMHVGFNALMNAIEGHHITFDGFAAQDLLRPVDAAIREAQRLVDIQIEKKSLADQERRLAGMKESISERKQKIAALERT